MHAHRIPKKSRGSPQVFLSEVKNVFLYLEFSWALSTPDSAPLQLWPLQWGHQTSSRESWTRASLFLSGAPNQDCAAKKVFVFINYGYMHVSSTICTHTEQKIWRCWCDTLPCIFPQTVAKCRKSFSIFQHIHTFKFKKATLGSTDLEDPCRRMFDKVVSAFSASLSDSALRTSFGNGRWAFRSSIVFFLKDSDDKYSLQSGVVGEKISKYVSVSLALAGLWCKV